MISNFNSGTTVTFPLYIFGAAQRGIPVEVNVIATMLFALTVVAMVFTVWQQRAGREARRGSARAGGRSPGPGLRLASRPATAAAG